MTRPEEGENPSLWVDVEKYSTLSGNARGDGKTFAKLLLTPSPDLVERSELVREL